MVMSRSFDLARSCLILLDLPIMGISEFVYLRLVKGMAEDSRRLLWVFLCLLNLVVSCWILLNLVVRRVLSLLQAIPLFQYTCSIRLRLKAAPNFAKHRNRLESASLRKALKHLRSIEASKHLRSFRKSIESPLSVSASPKCQISELSSSWSSWSSWELRLLVLLWRLVNLLK